MARKQKKGANVFEPAIDEVFQDPEFQAKTREIALSFFDHLTPDELESELQSARTESEDARRMLLVCATHLEAGRALPASVSEYLAEMLFRLAGQPLELLGEVLNTAAKLGRPSHSELAIIITGKYLEQTSLGNAEHELGVDESTLRRYYKRYKASGWKEKLDKPDS